MVVLGCCCRENHHEGGCRCLETHAAARRRKRTKQPVAAGCPLLGARCWVPWGRKAELLLRWLLTGGGRICGWWWWCAAVAGVGKGMGWSVSERERKWAAWFFVSEGRSTYNPNSSFYIIYTLIYLPRFIFLRVPTKKLTFVCSHVLNKIIILIRTPLFRNRDCIFLI